MVAEVFAGLSAFNSMFNIAKSMKDMNDENVRNKAVSELWEHIFTAQTRYAEAAEKIQELEAKLKTFEDWEAQKTNYELVELEPGIRVYRTKQAEAENGSSVEVCVSCFGDRHIGILQSQTWNPGRCDVMVCNDCGSVLYLSGSPHPDHKTYRPTPYKT
ncbi:RecJ-like exonuclease [Bradyrhizobium sp. USDA 4472]